MNNEYMLRTNEYINIVTYELMNNKIEYMLRTN